MATVKTGNITHDTAVAKAESIRQAAVVAAGPVQGSVHAADIAHYRSCLASAIATGVCPVPFITALRELGTGGA